MTDRDRKELAREIATHLHGNCPLGLTEDDAVALRDFLAAWKQTKRTALTTFVGLLVMAVVGVFGAGMIAKLVALLK